MDESYDACYFPILRDVEDRHFWFRGRNVAIQALLQGIRPLLHAGSKSLEIGCGNGNVLRVMQTVLPGNPVIGADLHQEGLRYAGERSSCPLVCCDVTHVPFGQVFGLVGLFDLIEHVPDDIQALESVRSVLSEGGFLVLTVPAHPSLWSAFDVASGHRRRYRLGDLTAKLRKAGFQVEYATPYMMSILPLLWLARKILKRRGRGATVQDARLAVTRDLRIVPLLNPLVAFLLAQEARLLRSRKRLPFGASILVLARKGTDQPFCFAGGDYRPDGGEENNELS